MVARTDFGETLLREHHEKVLGDYRKMKAELDAASVAAENGDDLAARLAEFQIPKTVPSDAPQSMSLQLFTCQEWQRHQRKVSMYALARKQPVQAVQPSASPAVDSPIQRTRLQVIGVLDTIEIPRVPTAHMMSSSTSVEPSRKRSLPTSECELDPVATKAAKISQKSSVSEAQRRDSSDSTVSLSGRSSGRNCPECRSPQGQKPVHQSPHSTIPGSKTNKYASLLIPRKPKPAETNAAPPANSTEVRRGSKIDKRNARVRTKEEERGLELLRQFRIRLDKILRDHSRLDAFVSDFRTDLHKLVFAKVTDDDIEEERLLSDETGLPAIWDPEFNQGIAWPWDLVADAKELYNNWKSYKFSVDLLEGINAPIKLVSASRASHWKIMEGYQVDYQKHGHNGLVAGQWWPRQICAVRDGAHGSHMAGISGSAEEGAWSVVMSGTQYERQDEDHGNMVWYSGTILSKGTVIDGQAVTTTRFTEIMLKSVGSRKPVRLMRSSNLGKSNEWKPSDGFRYDGLYLVTDKRVVDAIRGHYQFKLERQPGQPPIRRSDTLEGRPNPEEVTEWARIQKLKGINLSE